MKWNETLAGLGSYQPGKREEQVKAELGLERIVKLSSNENPFGTSEAVCGCLRELSYESFTELYPDGHAAALRKAVASFYQLEESELIFTAGVDELIGLLARALLRPDVNTVMRRQRLFNMLIMRRFVGPSCARYRCLKMVPMILKRCSSRLMKILRWFGFVIRITQQGIF